MNNKIKYKITYAAGIILPILLWEIIIHLKIISTVFLPSPSSIFISLANNWNDILISLSFTLFRSLCGFISGVILGIVIGLLLGYKPKFKLFFSPFIELLRSIPVLCLFPLFLLFFGIGDLSKIMVASWASFFIIIIPTVYAVEHVPIIKIDTAKMFGANKLRIFKDIILPASLPEIAGGLRVALSISLISVVVTEMFTGTRVGIGKYIYDAGLIYETDKLYAGILSSGLVGILINYLLLKFENDLIHWKSKI
jgi:NitT/TauT family transport system permease protein